MKNALLLLCLALLCTAGSAEAKKKEEPLVIKVGKTFEVSLHSLATAGYEWHLLEGYNEGVVAYKMNKQGELPKGAPLGRSPDEIFVFEALKPGNTALDFAQYRSWESAEGAARHRVVIKVIP